MRQPRVQRHSLSRLEVREQRREAKRKSPQKSAILLIHGFLRA